jgi:hypothetical protein
MDAGEPRKNPVRKRKPLVRGDTISLSGRLAVVIPSTRNTLISLLRRRSSEPLKPFGLFRFSAATG